MKKISILFSALFVLINLPCISSQNPDGLIVNAKVDFSATFQDWDGFGVNYVELAQSTNPITDPQKHGGFSRLT